MGILREAGPQVQQQSVCKRADASAGLKVPRRISILLARGVSIRLPPAGINPLRYVTLR